MSNIVVIIKPLFLKTIPGMMQCIILLSAIIGFSEPILAQTDTTKFKVIAFYTSKMEPAHISFVHEVNKWFPQIAARYNFTYDSTDDWNNMNAAFLSKYQVVLFLDSRPEDPAQRKAFQTYMEQGGAWIGFHFAGFALTPSDFPQNWDWYHNQFIGAGQYKSNTWRPTAAILRVEDINHPTSKNLPSTFESSPNEWYRWENDLRKDPDIRILLSIDSSSFPLGTGPKPHEIWHSGYYPVAWTNKKYKMVYINMGHNDVDFDSRPIKDLSLQLANPIQNQFLINALLWLGSK